MNRALVTAALLFASAPAHANVWERAIEHEASDRSDRVYDKELREGDEHVHLANSRGSSLRLMREQIQQALLAYRNAAIAEPKAAEPYLRIGDVIYAFYLENCSDMPYLGVVPSPLRDCTRRDGSIDPRMAQQAIDAWTAGEAREPLHPRFTPGFGESILFTRAILHTKLATKDHLALAVIDYQRILDRSDGTDADSMERTWGNLAETKMMLGELDDAIAAYREAWRRGATASTAYGLAVALDRDARETTAAAVIVDQGLESYRAFKEGIARESTFFVPHGEVFYYFALIEEAWGNDDLAIGYWRDYIASKAHPQFQPRAKAHLDALIAKKRAQGRPIPPQDPFMDQR